MLCAHTRLRSGPVEFDYDVVLERDFRMFSVRRTETMLDTRFSPPNGRSSAGQAVLYILLDGELRWHPPEELAVTGPAAFIAPLHDLVGGAGRRSRSYRSGGALYRSLQLWLPERFLARRCSAPQRIALAGTTIGAARVYGDLVHGDRPYDAATREDALRLLLAGLLRDGALSTDLSASIVRDEGVFGHLWKHGEPWFASLALSGSLDTLASRVGVSLRQMGRRLDDFGVTFDLPWDGWRALARGMRLRFAVLLLSNPHLSIATIAELSGYSSAEALSHALRAEGLPPPFEVRSLTSARPMILST